MLTPDSIIPDPMNPQSYNRYSYTFNNPLRYTDPDGHEPCATGNGFDCTPESQWMYTPSIRRIEVYGYGVFDKEHIKRGHRSAEFLYGEIAEAVIGGSDNIAIPVSTYSEDRIFSREYLISPLISADQVDGVALGIYMDFEIGYESWQASGNTTLLGILGAFAPEDLPSDYVGFWGYAEDLDLFEVQEVINDMGMVTVGNENSLVFGSRKMPGLPVALPTIPRNRNFEPMAPLLGSGEVIWRNVPWPHNMQMTPIESSPGTWMPLHE